MEKPAVKEEVAPIEKEKIPEPATEEPKYFYEQSDGIFQSASFEMKKTNIFGVLAVIIIVGLLAASIFLPWYNFNVHVSGNISNEAIGGAIGISDNVDTNGLVDFHLTKMSFKTSYKSTFTGLQTQNSPDMEAKYTESDLKQQMDITYYLTIISVVLAILAMIMFFIFLFKKITKKIVFIFFILLTVFTFVILIYFSVSIPSTINNNIIQTNSNYNSMVNVAKQYDGSLFGSYKTTIPWSEYPMFGSGSQGFADIEISWKPSFGWFMVLSSTILSLICLLIILAWKNEGNT